MTTVTSYGVRKQLNINNTATTTMAVRKRHQPRSSCQDILSHLKLVIMLEADSFIVCTTSNGSHRLQARFVFCYTKHRNRRDLRAGDIWELANFHSEVNTRPMWQTVLCVVWHVWLPLRSLIRHLHDDSHNPLLVRWFSCVCLHMRCGDVDAAELRENIYGGRAVLYR